MSHAPDARPAVSGANNVGVRLAGDGDFKIAIAGKPDSYNAYGERAG
jgi:hypothetical protein